jgi:hypothetical protein
MSWWNPIAIESPLTMGAAQVSTTWQTTTIGPATNTGILVGMAGPVYLRVPTMNDLQQNAAFQASITELVDVWRVKYGDKWVDAGEVNADSDGFYAFAAQRLLQYNLLEQHAIHNPSYVTVYKLKDQVER